MLLHTVRKEKRAGEGVCACVWGGPSHICLVFWIYNYLRLNSPHNISGPKSDTPNFSDRGLPKALSALVYRTH